MMRLCRRRVLVLAIATMVCGAGCRSSGPVADAGAPFDLETMAFLSEARALHHEANVKEDEGDARGAVAAIDRIVRAQRPHAGAPLAPEVEEVLADAYARLAELELHAGEPESAARAADQGLTHARAANYFRGHLLEVRGVIEESRAASLADAGDVVGAARARSVAMRLLEEAVTVQGSVIEAALEGGASEGAPR